MSRGGSGWSLEGDGAQGEHRSNEGLHDLIAERRIARGHVSWSGRNRAGERQRFVVHDLL